MSSGTNSERILRNNNLLATIKTQIDNLPESSTELNVFIQTTEPSTYNGLWVKTNNITQETIIEVSSESNKVANSLNILKGNNYSTILIPSSIVNGATYKFNGVLLTDTNNNVDYSTQIYYGDGLQWVDITPS